jgi:hypothetical protein
MGTRLATAFFGTWFLLLLSDVSGELRVTLRYLAQGSNYYLTSTGVMQLIEPIWLSFQENFTFL